MLAIALNRIYTPILRQQIPEITDFFPLMEALSYKLAVISIDKAYPGQAKRAAMAFWSALPQFTYTKFVVVDSHINVRDPRQVVWAIAAQVDPARPVHPGGHPVRQPGFRQRTAGSRRTPGHRCHHKGGTGEESRLG